MTEQHYYTFTTFNPNLPSEPYVWIFAGDCETCERPVYTDLHFMMNPGEMPEAGEITRTCTGCQKSVTLSNTFQNCMPDASGPFGV